MQQMTAAIVIILLPLLLPTTTTSATTKKCVVVTFPAFSMEKQRQQQWQKEQACRFYYCRIHENGSIHITTMRVDFIEII